MSRNLYERRGRHTWRARWFRFTVVRFPHTVKTLFQEWLEHHGPGKDGAPDY